MILNNLMQLLNTYSINVSALEKAEENIADTQTLEDKKSTIEESKDNSSKSKDEQEAADKIKKEADAVATAKLMREIFSPIAFSSFIGLQGYTGTQSLKPKGNKGIFVYASQIVPLFDFKVAGFNLAVGGVANVEIVVPWGMNSVFATSEADLNKQKDFTNAANALNDAYNELKKAAKDEDKEAFKDVTVSTFTNDHTDLVANYNKASKALKNSTSSDPKDDDIQGTDTVAKLANLPGSQNNSKVTDRLYNESLDGFLRAGLFLALKNIKTPLGAMTSSIEVCFVSASQEGFLFGGEALLVTGSVFFPITIAGRTIVIKASVSSDQLHKSWALSFQGLVFTTATN